MFMRGRVVPSDSCVRPHGTAAPLARLAVLAATLCAACTIDSSTSPSVPAGVVRDLAVVTATVSSVTLGWTDVFDGADGPATYRVKYATPLLEWSTAKTGCAEEIDGVQVGSRITCTVEGLESGTQYEFQLMSYRDANGTMQEPQYSNLAHALTARPSVAEQTELATTGIWISPAEIVRLPTYGPAWENLLAAAGRPCGSVDLSDQEQSTNVCVLAKALVFVRTGVPNYRADVVDAIQQIATSGTYDGRALALGRELGAYVVAADLIALKTFDPTLDASFRAKLRALRTTYTSGAAANLIECHEKRPNNWGAHCGATRAAIAVYLGDADELARTARVFKGYLGDRTSYSEFEFDGPSADLTWQCDPAQPVGINPTRCTRSGSMLDGVLPDDQR